MGQLLILALAALIAGGNWNNARRKRQKEKYGLLVSSCGEGQRLIFYETNREDHRRKR